jgi:hypothetical protein
MRNNLLKEERYPNSAISNALLGHIKNSILQKHDHANTNLFTRRG